MICLMLWIHDVAINLEPSGLFTTEDSAVHALKLLILSEWPNQLDEFVEVRTVCHTSTWT